MTASLDDLTAKIDAGERLSDQDIAALGSSRDIITLGMLATTVRRRLRGNEVTYVRVADLKVGTTARRATAWPTLGGRLAGEVRIFQTPRRSTRPSPSLRRRATWPAALRSPHSASSSLASCRKGCLSCCRRCRKAGLEIVTQAPIDRLAAPERALEALADAGLKLARLTVNETPEREWTEVCREVAALQTRLGAIRAFAPLARKDRCDAADDWV